MSTRITKYVAHEIWNVFIKLECVSGDAALLRLISHGIVLFIPGKGRRTFKKPECGMTFGAVKHSVYETNTKCEQLRYTRRDFVKIALPCSLKAIRSISHEVHAIFIGFHSTSQRCEIKDKVNF